MSINFDLNLLKTLEGLGLSDKESKTYIGLLQGGEMSAITLSRNLGLHRQFVYTALATLKDRGLVVQIGEVRAKWRAQSPRKLISTVEEQQILASRAVEQLLALKEEKAGQEFEVTEGIKSFRAQQLAAIRSAPHGSTVLMICGEWKRYFDRAGDMHDDWDAIRIAKEIKFRMIGPESLRNSMQDSVKRGLTTYRTLPHLEENLVNTIIYDNEVMTEIYGDPHLTFSVKNPIIAESQKTFFETLWNLAKE